MVGHGTDCRATGMCRVAEQLGLEFKLVGTVWTGEIKSAGCLDLIVACG